MWDEADYRFHLGDGHDDLPGELAGRVFGAVWRVDFAAPGFAVLDLGPAADSHRLRARMLGLKDQLDAAARRRGGPGFAYRSLGRFDQQVTTRWHRDGAPARSLLMLGYEPSAVASRLALADYARCAHDLGIEPQRFLDEFNPMYRSGEEKLDPYRTELPPPSAGCGRIVLINNSALPFDGTGRNPLGVLHQGEIPRPDPARRRIINSIMLQVDEPEVADAATLREFVATEAISGAISGAG